MVLCTFTRIGPKATLCEQPLGQTKPPGQPGGKGWGGGRGVRLKFRMHNALKGLLYHPQNLILCLYSIHLVSIATILAPVTTVHEVDEKSLKGTIAVYQKRGVKSRSLDYKKKTQPVSLIVRTSSTSHLCSS